jgi:GntR family transcriptional regulator / MocR family aminotransferase
VPLDLPALALDHAAATPLFRQLYDRLRAAILAGQLAPGARLPSSRSLAGDLGVSRNTVLGAFDQLVAEGYLVGRVGSGTRVAPTLPETLLHAPGPRVPVSPERPPAAAPHTAASLGAVPCAAGAAAPSPAMASSPAAAHSAAVAGLPRRGPSRRGALLAATPVAVARALPPTARAFRAGLPGLDAFPFALWARLVARRARRLAATSGLLDYADPAGYRPLREAIAAHLGATRAVRCEPEQVLVVAGSQHGLDLAARVLLDPGDRVWIEDPGYLGARGALVGAGARLVPVPVDDEGLSVSAGERLAPDARLAYVTPSHQYPLGVAMSLARRLALLDWAGRADAWLLEDDYDSTYRYAGRPLAALQGLDRDGRVVYLGTFSKVLFPGLRLGYVVVPPDLVEAFAAARALVDRHPPALDQLVLADFMAEGHFGRHLRRTRALYAERQATLVEEAGRHLDGRLEVAPAEAGMHLVGWLPAGHDDRHASARAAALGLDVQPLSRYVAASPSHFAAASPARFAAASPGHSVAAPPPRSDGRPAPRPGLVLGYAGVPLEEIRAGVRRLAEALA